MSFSSFFSSFLPTTYADSDESGSSNTGVAAGKHMDQQTEGEMLGMDDDTKAAKAEAKEAAESDDAEEEPAAEEEEEEEPEDVCDACVRNSV
jgi:hypothetical protein